MKIFKLHEVLLYMVLNSKPFLTNLFLFNWQRIYNILSDRIIGLISGTVNNPVTNILDKISTQTSTLISTQISTKMYSEDYRLDCKSSEVYLITELDAKVEADLLV
jgi:hypothetical protein